MSTISYTEFVIGQHKEQFALGAEAARNGATWKDVLRLQIKCTRRYYREWWKLTCAKFNELHAQRRAS